MKTLRNYRHSKQAGLSVVIERISEEMEVLNFNTTKSGDKSVTFNRMGFFEWGYELNIQDKSEWTLLQVRSAPPPWTKRNTLFGLLLVCTLGFGLIILSVIVFRLMLTKSKVMKIMDRCNGEGCVLDVGSNNELTRESKTGDNNSVNIQVNVNKG